MFGLGIDDLIFMVISIIGIWVIGYWLRKIYRRIKDIDKIIGHLFEEYLKTKRIK